MIFDVWFTFFSLVGPNFGHVYTLPHLGRGRWENIVLNPYEQDLTIAVMSDDRHPAGILVRLVPVFVCDTLFFLNVIYVVGVLHWYQTKCGQRCAESRAQQRSILRVFGRWSRRQSGRVTPLI